MYNTLKRLFLEGRLSTAGLENAVTKGWITEAEKNKLELLKAVTDAQAQLD